MFISNLVFFKNNGTGFANFTKLIFYSSDQARKNEKPRVLIIAQQWIKWIVNLPS